MKSFFIDKLHRTFENTSAERQRWVLATGPWRSGLMLVLLILPLTLSLRRIDSTAGEKAMQARLRRPVALVPADEGKRLYVANHRSGTVSLIDVEKSRVIDETMIGKMLTDLTDVGADRLLTIDEATGEMVALSRKGDRLTVVGRVYIGDSPVSVRALNRNQAVVACLWPRLLVLVDLSSLDRPRTQKYVSLPFAPRAQLVLPGGERILVADAFGGHLAVVDIVRGKVESVRAVPGHNIRCMAVSANGKELLLTQQVLNEAMPARADDVRWGSVITNNVRALALEDVLNPNADLLRRSRLYPLGQFQRGAADPSGLVIGHGKIIVALSGTGEIAFGPAQYGDWPRLALGRRPTAIAKMGKLSFIADTFGDAVMVVDVEKCQTIASISLGPMPSLSPQERGELLFFDGRLSVEGWMSCHSCHTDGHTNGLLSDTLGDGSYGAPKRIPTLRGVGDTAPWAWNGSMERLEDQVSQSIRTTMHGSRPSSRQVADLIAYLRSLTPPPLPQPLSSLGGRGARDEGVKDAVRRGAAQFQTRGCVRCHAAPTYTTPKTYDVGLEDELGKKLFNPPSLRGVRHGVTFFHDGRATSLREVFSRYHHQIPADMPRKELDDLLTFLHSL